MKLHLRAALVATSGAVLLNAFALSAAKVERAADSAAISFIEPVIGHVFDADKGQIRTILGIPGAARVADPLVLNATVQNVVIGAAGKLAIASVRDGDTAMLVRPFDSPPAMGPISGAMKSFTVGAFSPSGAAAILFGPDCNCVQVAASFADSPAITHVIDASALPGDITAIAINDNASLAAIAVAGLADGSQPAQVVIFNLNGDATPQVVLTTSASALAFSPAGKDLAIVDVKSHSLSLVQDAAGGAGVLKVAGEADGLSMPSAVTFISPNLLLVGDRSGQVDVISLQGDPVKPIPCSCKPTAVEPMALKSTYRLTGLQLGAVWILTITDSDAAVRFVPVDSDDSDNTQTGNPQ